MIAKMPYKMLAAVRYCCQFSYWEKIIGSKGMFMDGYQAALDDMKNGVDPERVVEVEFVDGAHQGSMARVVEEQDGKFIITRVSQDQAYNDSN